LLKSVKTAILRHRYMQIGVVITYIFDLVFIAIQIWPL
jgi:hypothetical protein